MDFSYAQNNIRYRQLMKSNVVILFLNSRFDICHTSPNLDVLGFSVGKSLINLPFDKFAGLEAGLMLRESLDKIKGDGASVQLSYQLQDVDSAVELQHVFYSGAGDFDGEVRLRSYIIAEPTQGDSQNLFTLIAEFEASLRYISLLSHLSVGVFIHSENKITYANQRLCQTLGYTAEELIGNPVTHYLHPDSAAQLRSRFDKQTHKKYRTEALRKDGSIIPVNINIKIDSYAADDSISYIGVLEDATNYKISEQTDMLLTKIYEQLSEGVFLLDRERRITWLNEAAAKLLETNIEDMTGKSLEILQSTRHKPEFYSEMWQTTDAKGMCRSLVWVVKPNGGEIPLRTVYCAIRNDDAEIISYLAVFDDASSTASITDLWKQNSMTDTLTALPNKQYFELMLESKIEQCREADKEFYLVDIEIDQFKVVVEMYGHTISDTLLIQLSQRLKRVVPENSVVARIADEEFGILLDDADSVARISDFATKLLDVLNKPFFIMSYEINIYVSVGIALYDSSNPSKETLCKNADAAVSLAKLNWKSDFQIYHDSDTSKYYPTLADKLLRAVTYNEFVMYYQPRLDTLTRRVVAVEALVRWQSPEMGLVLPRMFLATAEESGLMDLIGKMIFTMACAQLQKWRRNGFEGIHMSVNLSSLQLRNELIADEFLEIMSRFEVDPKYIELELTESFAFQERSITSVTLKRFVDAGVSIALDDFGTGYSSLSLLRKFPINVLTVDRSFVKDIPGDADNKSIVDAIIAIARSLGLRTVAEGVETIEQYEYLSGIGCDEVQGYLIGRPVPPDDIERLLESYDASDDMDIDIDFTDFDMDIDFSVITE